MVKTAIGMRACRDTGLIEKMQGRLGDRGRARRFV